MGKYYMEFQNTNNEINLSDIRTCNLVNELKKRIGVKVTYADPYEDVTVNANGPATILIVID